MLRGGWRCGGPLPKRAEGGSCRSNVRMTSLVVWIISSTLPFLGEVWGQEDNKVTPLVEKNVRRQELINSAPLSQCMLHMVTLHLCVKKREEM